MAKIPAGKKAKTTKNTTPQAIFPTEENFTEEINRDQRLRVTLGVFPDVDQSDFFYDPEGKSAAKNDPRRIFQK